MPKILIIGHGFVGNAVDYGFSHQDVKKEIVDPKYGTDTSTINVHDFDYIFVCVPTPMGDSGGVDASIVGKILQRLKQVKDIPIIIKSTIPPDIIGVWKDRTNVVYNPEFLTEKSANEQFIDPQFHILGGDREYTNKVEQLYNQYSLCNPCPVLHMTTEEASFVKYTINSFLATKVTFFNQLYDAVEDTSANFATIIKAVGMDSRIGSSHTRAPGFDGKQGYGGACFPKDVSAFTNYNKRLTLLKEVSIINNMYRQQYEMDEREIEQHVNYGQIKEELKDQIDGYPV
jgi:UDPglucose 6-dehydrogenase